ncbi:pks3, partial [Symbiodinium necroappetens]
MPIDLCKTPWNVQKICEEATLKELNADLRRAITRGESVPREYKLQAPGEEVQLQGMRRHEGLNGRQGEVLSRIADDQGFLLVRVQMEDGAA